MEENEVKVVEQTTEQPVESHEDQTEPKSRTVPLDKFLKEKERRKALEARISEIERTAADSPAKGFEEKYKALGFDDESARAIANDFAAVLAASKKAPEKDTVGEELEDLVLESEWYDDAKAFEKEIREAIRSGRAPDVKSAYTIVRDPLERAREIQNRGRAAPKAQPSSATPPAVPSDALTPDEKNQLAELQENMPWANWDAKSFKQFYRRN